jgi:outer membrane receptor protein involved in Fe transport
MKLRFGLVFTALVAFGSEPLAEEASTTLPEISVVGTAISAPLQTAPISASVRQKEELIERAADNFQQLIDFTPNLNFSGGTARPRFFQIRGVGELEQYEGAPNPSVGLFIDDLDLSGLGAGSSLFDIEQLEVLRGPQSIRFGANSLAGAINYRSADPSDEYRGLTQISLGSDELIAGGVAVGGPIDGTDGKLQFRLSTYRQRSDGFRENLFLNRNDTNKRDESTSRVKLRALPNEWLKVDLMGTWIDFANGYDAFAIDNSFNTQSDRPGHDLQRTAGGVLKNTIRLGTFGELQSISGFSQSDNRYGFDGDWGNPELWEPFNPYDFRFDSLRRRKTVSQELRLSGDTSEYTHGESSRWVAGAFAQYLGEETSIEQFADEAPYDQLESQYIGRTAAAFAQYEIPLAPGLSLTPGIRAELRSMSYSDTRENDFNPINRMWGGHLTLGYDLSKETFSYLLLSRGFRGGGFNTSVNVPENNRAFSPEALWNIEAGIKTELLERKLRLNSSVFSMFRRSQQVRFGFQADPTDPLTFSYITDNASRGVNLGLESELTYLLSERVRLFLAGSLLHTEFRDYQALGRDLTGRGQSHAAPWQVAVGSRMSITENLFARIDLSGRGPFYFDDVHDQRSSAYGILNATVGYETENFRIQLWARNLLDERYAVRGFFFGNEPPDFPEKLYIQRGDPLQAGVTMTYHFGAEPL